MSFNEYFSEYFSFNEYISAIILHPRKQEVEVLHVCNHATVIRLSYLRFI